MSPIVLRTVRFQSMRRIRLRQICEALEAAHALAPDASRSPFKSARWTVSAKELEDAVMQWTRSNA